MLKQELDFQTDLVNVTI